MSGTSKRRSRKNIKKQDQVEEQPVMEKISEHEASEHEKDPTEKMEGQDSTETLRIRLATISRDIKDHKQELRHELTAFKDELKREMKEEITNLRQEIDRKLTENNRELQAQQVSISEAQARIAEVEEWRTDANDALTEMMEQAHRMQEKLTDLEGRSRRNNIRVFGLPEDTEGSSTTRYLEQLLKTELELHQWTNLQIQRAHRALAQKPSLNAAPRSIVVNFLQFEMKEMILKKVWQKKIQVGGKQIYFDHDYPTEIVQKRRACAGIKKVLKEKGIRFQTPLAKIQIHWNNGVKTHESARGATRDMKERGYTVDEPGGNTAPVAEERQRGAAVWQRVKGALSERKTAKLLVEILKMFCLRKEVTLWTVEKQVWKRTITEYSTKTNY